MWAERTLHGNVNGFTGDIIHVVLQTNLCEMILESDRFAKLFS